MKMKIRALSKNYLVGRMWALFRLQKYTDQQKDSTESDCKEVVRSSRSITEYYARLQVEGSGTLNIISWVTANLISSGRKLRGLKGKSLETNIRIPVIFGLEKWKLLSPLII